MCISPNHIWITKAGQWEKLPKACGKCWRCRSNRVNDYVGRSLCELTTSDWAKVITLTYAPRTDGAEQVINPRHFQEFIKRLRFAKLKIRYLAVAEKGTKFGRVHFHAILFGKGKEPQVSQKNKSGWPTGTNTHIQAWPHGHVYVDGRQATEAAIRYACKYVLKGEGEHWFTLSKKPSLGAEYFKTRAQFYVDTDTMPRGFEYLPPNGTKNKKYLLTGATRRDFLNNIIDGLKEKNSFLLQHGTTGLFATPFGTLSEFVQLAVEKIEREQAQKEAENQPIEIHEEKLDETYFEKYTREQSEALAAWRVRAKMLHEQLEREIAEREDGEQN